MAGRELDNLRPLVRPPKKEAFTLPEANFDQVAYGIGFGWITRLETVGKPHIDLDNPPALATLAREELQGTRFVPEFPGVFGETMELLVTQLDRNVLTALYTGMEGADDYLFPPASEEDDDDDVDYDDPPTRADRLKAVGNLLRQNLKDPFVEGLARRMRTLVRAERIRDSKHDAAGTIAALLLTGDETARSTGPAVLYIPTEVKDALQEFLTQKGRIGGNTLQFFRASEYDPATYRDQAKERNEALSELICTVFDDIDAETLQKFQQASPQFSANFRRTTHGRARLTPLNNLSKALNNALRAYAQLKDEDTSHFGTIIDTGDGKRILGIGFLIEALEAAEEFTGVDGKNLELFMPGLRDFYTLPAITAEPRQGKVITKSSDVIEKVRATNAQIQFVQKMTHEIFNLMRAIDATYKKAVKAGDEFAELKRDMRYGIVSSMLATNVSLMASLFQGNSALSGLWGEMINDPNKFIRSKKLVSDLAFVSHFDLRLVAASINELEDSLSIIFAALGLKE